MASTNISRALSSGAATTKFTYSVWLKYSGFVAGGQRWFSAIGTGDTYFRFNENGTMEISGYNSGATSLGYFITNRKFQDNSGWYHLVIKSDTTQSTEADRFKLYINGVQETSFSTATYPNQNATDNINLAGNTQYIGGAASSQYFNGVMSHVIYCDNYAYDASSFGETDSTTGEWKINTSPSVTYGTNGFYLLKDGNSVTDQSGSSNDFAYSGGTLTNTKDCPDNVFSTLNPLIKASNQPTFTNANTTVISPSGTNARYGGTLGMTSGKYYYEVKLLGSVTNGGFSAGMLNIDSFNFNSTSGISSSSNYIGAVVNNNNLNIQHGGASNDFTPTVALGSIIGHAIDMDNGYYYVHVNGVYLNSGDPTSGDTGTGNINRTGNLNYDFSTLTMAIGGSSQNVDFGSFNFGNGTFGTTAVSSAGTNASNNGVFEYDVPTGYTALSTKGLNL